MNYISLTLPSAGVRPIVRQFGLDASENPQTTSRNTAKLVAGTAIVVEPLAKIFVRNDVKIDIMVRFYLKPGRGAGSVH